jgi:hypothetical protein
MRTRSAEHGPAQTAGRPAGHHGRSAMQVSPALHQGLYARAPLYPGRLAGHPPTHE